MNETTQHENQDPVTEAEETTSGAEVKVENDLNLVSDLVQKLTAERDELQAQVLRTMADFQNFRKRNQAETVLLRQFATQALIEKLLPVLDNFERTIKAANSGATMESLVGGIGAVERQLKSALEGQGLVRIESVGQPFDANLHEALATVPSADHPADTVIDEIEAGYKIGDKVIRPAKVRVTIEP